MTALVFNFVVPIIMLMSRDAKRITSRVLIIGSIILVGHYLDFFVMIMPGCLCCVLFQRHCAVIAIRG